MSSSMSSYSNEIDDDASQHIVFLIHGLHGTTTDFDELHRHFSSSRPNLLIHRVRANDGFLKTHRGIDEGGVSVAREIQSLAIPDHVKKVSFIGHSLGGLFARYAVAFLLQLGFFEQYAPVNFITLASPHLGTRRPQGLLNSVIDGWTRTVLDKSGAQLLLEDPGGPLLSAMAHPDSNASKALRLFRRRALYANVTGDPTVPYFTSSLRPCVHPLDPEELIHHPDWPGIVIHPQECDGATSSSSSVNVGVDPEGPRLGGDESDALDAGPIRDHRSASDPDRPAIIGDPFPADSLSSPPNPSPPGLLISDDIVPTTPSSSSGFTSSSDTEIVLDPFYHALQEDPKFPVISEMAFQLDQLSWEKYDVYLDSSFSHVLIAGKSPPLLKSKVSRRIPKHIVHHFLL